MSDSSRFATYAEFTPARPRFTTSKVRSGWRAATMRCRWSERRWSVGTIAPAACESPTSRTLAVPAVPAVSVRTEQRRDERCGLENRLETDDADDEEGRARGAPRLAEEVDQEPVHQLRPLLM